MSKIRIASNLKKSAISNMMLKEDSIGSQSGRGTARNSNRSVQLSVKSMMRRRMIKRDSKKLNEDMSLNIKDVARRNSIFSQAGERMMVHSSRDKIRTENSTFLSPKMKSRKRRDSMK